MRDKLAFPGWSMGQVLLPEQFVALQDTLTAHWGRRALASGLPAHGLLRLRWSDELLATGAIRIHALTWVFESGFLLDVPGNAVIGNLNLADVSEREVTLYLHVLAEPRDASDLVTYADDEPSVTRVIYAAELSLADHRDHARESVKLAELVRRDDRWELGRFSPPLLAVGTSPFLQGTLQESHRAVERIERQLAGRSLDAFLGADQLAELRRVRTSAYRTIALLADHGIGAEPQEVWLHPYALFTQLRDFHVELCVLQGTAPTPWPLRYRHRAVAECFEDVRQRIDHYTGESRLIAPRLEFERKGEWFVTGVFPDELCTTSEVYLVVKPGRAGTASLEGVKLASPRRVEEVVTRALPGIRFAPLESVSLSHTYGGDAALYELLAQGSEWRFAVRERAVCFWAAPELEGISAALVWKA